MEFEAEKLEKEQESISDQSIQDDEYEPNEEVITNNNNNRIVLPSIEIGG